MSHPNRKNKRLPYAIGFLVLIMIVLVVGKKQGWFGKDFEVKVITQVVESRTITELITANGKIQPETEVKISPDVSGEIIGLYVEEGDEVQAGQLLVVIKPDIYEQALNRAEASLNSSKAYLAQSQARLIESELAFNRAQSLFDQQAIASRITSYNVCYTKLLRACSFFHKNIFGSNQLIGFT